MTIKLKGEEALRNFNPIGRYVGLIIPVRRTVSRMSQERLADSLGVTFQQAPKHEDGINRVSASRLLDISRILDTPISHFFDDLDNREARAEFDDLVEALHERTVPKQALQTSSEDQIIDREVWRLVMAYSKIASKTTRKSIMDLVITLASPKTDSAASSP